MPRARPLHTATQLWNSAAHATPQVVAARLAAFADPLALSSPWHQAEAQRMASEKVGAAQAGTLAAGTALALLPARLWQIAMRPATWTPAGMGGAWMDAAALWVDVGNAALRPAQQAVVRNRSRLARRTR